MRILGCCILVAIIAAVVTVFCYFPPLDILLLTFFAVMFWSCVIALHNGSWR